MPVGFVYTPGISDRSNSFVSSSAEARRTFYESHRLLALFMLLIVFAAPFAGLYVAGLFGVVAGVLISAAAYVLLPWLW
jgi:hypothetical protein